ncbi:RibD family protein [Nocardia paucivorans]|uniref:RibD family protein n=1 Tax=Nocardia paucivorans TaxID=114259 RepID=UPI0002EE84E1|nr:RibD family protein [Nocardia paucivorans]
MIRPFVVLSVAMSVDGYIDDAGPERLLLSNAADFDRVDQVRAESDAILVGAETVRRDNPRLIVRDANRRAARVAAGRPAYPRKVTVTASGELDPTAAFWHHGTEGQRPLVYTTDAGAEKLTVSAELAEVVVLGPDLDFGALLDDLGGRGIERLMVEGGSRIHTAFLSAGLADELHLAIGPTLVGDPRAPRFLGPATFPGGSTRRMRLLDISRIGDIALLRYRPKESS